MQDLEPTLSLVRRARYPVRDGVCKNRDRLLAGEVAPPGFLALYIVTGRWVHHVSDTGVQDRSYWLRSDAAHAPRSGYERH